jgi:hypothetical protein
MVSLIGGNEECVRGRVRTQNIESFVVALETRNYW